jgi:hypothetical protein
MGNKKIESFLNRRMLTDSGWNYFCRLCGEYKHESQFYNSKDTPFGKTYKCKVHYIKDKEPPDPEYDYLKMNPISDRDFVETERILKTLGYKIGPDELPVWRQFEIKHKLK